MTNRTFFNVEYLLWLALILALAGSLKHLASVFASVDGNIFLGWLQAVAIDAGVFALAYQIRIRRKERRNTKRLWTGVLTFTGISVYGNLAYGLQAVNGTLPALIQATKPYVLAATLPLLVLFLAELLGDDREYARELAQPQRRERTATESKPAQAQAKPQGKQRKESITKVRAARLLEQTPEMTGAELARAVGVSGQRGRQLKTELKAQVNGKEAQQ